VGSVTHEVSSRQEADEALDFSDALKAALTSSPIRVKLNPSHWLPKKERDYEFELIVK